MFVKYIGDGVRPLCGSTVINKEKASHVTNEVKLKRLIEKGYEFEILDNKEWVSAKDYYKEDEKEDGKEDEKEDVVESVTEVNKIEVVEKEVEESEDRVIDYSSMFDDHWRKRSKNVREYTDDLGEVDKILEYAKRNNEPVTVIQEIEEYREGLE